MKSQRNIFITGGLGYVGGRCSKALVALGFRVIIGTRRAEKIEAPDWLTNGCLAKYSCDMGVATLESSLAGVDSIVHFASPNEIVSAQYPEVAIEQNMIGTLRLCQAAKVAGVRHLVFFSTAHVYGTPLEGHYSEESLPQAKHPYSYSHLAAEHVLRSFAGSGGIPQITIVRLTNGFGAPERADVDRWTLLVNDLCYQAVQKKSLTLNSDGSPLRDFITLSDVERAVGFLLTYEPRNAFEIFNLGSGRSMRVLEMAQMISEVAHEILGENIPIHRPDKSGQPMAARSLKIDVSKLEKLGFKLENNFRPEIESTINFVKANIES